MWQRCCKRELIIESIVLIGKFPANFQMSANFDFPYETAFLWFNFNIRCNQFSIDNIMSGNIGSDRSDQSSLHQSVDLCITSSVYSKAEEESRRERNCIDFVNYCQYFHQLCNNSNESVNASNDDFSPNKVQHLNGVNPSARRSRKHFERKPRQAYNTKQLERLEHEFQVCRSKCNHFFSFFSLFDSTERQISERK